mmetsp:Transcript_4814/g.4008  ORF Transcript_4814/g.4008 Transcript_4814/m.4008 type:complete len:149 (-) Transcript_4814:181-627(-)|eukprot:CAMPEP_0114575176 /NCGR_PEP_ID=MMETSP0125-20121206/81_1 /TAXON_ID=485358 ORGANISM="Aristerostoma sp., Strain ATCC 50986" /NCGR_SAMPLE_ID=MMETSP0125 /ASSEMBLY_ACC=CAM_ASM_000245 /LENGTH=148 /DNA_ID=CAMNT_0001762715 /DNA_START=1215 /DNA_END=1661 /DNA_ORIENTATION=-
MTLNDMSEYVAIKIKLADKSTKLTTLNYSNENFLSSVGVYYYSRDKNYKLNNSNISDIKDINDMTEKKLSEVFFKNEEINFAEEDLHMFKIRYDGENLYFSKDDYNMKKNMSKYGGGGMDLEDHVLKVPLKISQLLSLDMGRAYVGFV